MGEFKQSTPGVDRFLKDARDATWHKYHGYSKVEFIWKGAVYQLVSTGDFYRLDCTGMPMLICPFPTEYKGKTFLSVSIADQRNYYVTQRKQLRLKDLVWAAFGDRDLPKNHYVSCKNGNYRSCGIDNLEVKLNGVP